MLPDWIKVLPLQKNTIAGGSLPGFFSIAVVTSSDGGKFLCGFSFNFRKFSTAKSTYCSFYYCEDWNSGGFSPRPLDYLAWGVFELRVRAKPHNKPRTWSWRSGGVMVSLARNIVAKACKRFRSQIEAVVVSVHSCAILFLLQWYRMVSAVLCHFKKLNWNSGFIATTL